MSTELSQPGLHGDEKPHWFTVDGEQVLGILHEVTQASDVAVLVIVGGPQYRVGSHRQFVLLARDIARAGFPVMRFDYRGMGDSEGSPRDFEQVNADIAAAVETLKNATGARRVVLWGLCDAASAAMIYVADDPDIAALILLNPWVYTEQGEAVVRLKSYYLKRLLNPDFWRKVLRFDVDFADSWRSLLGYWRGTRNQRDVDAGEQHYIDRMLAGLQGFEHATYMILSGDDLTAREFEELLKSSHQWSTVYQRRCRDEFRIDEANHTFARREWRDRVAAKSISWLREINR